MCQCTSITHKHKLYERCNACIQVYDPTGDSEDLIAPADEAEVRGYIFGFLHLLNSVSSQCGLCEYQKPLAYGGPQIARMFSCHLAGSLLSPAM